VNHVAAAATSVGRTQADICCRTGPGARLLPVPESLRAESCCRDFIGFSSVI
jgi:hypothetical protein